jgi:hypothetical protein
MTTIHTISVLPSQPEKGLRKLIIILATLFLVSCSHTATMHDKVTADSQKKPETVQKAREEEPRPGDTRVVNGVEYVYGKNVRYMISPGEPEYVWVRRDQYSPDALGSSRPRTGASAKEQQEMAERIARLEGDLKPGGAPQPASPAAQAASPAAQAASKPSLSDEAGRQWTNYDEDRDRVQYFYDRDSITHPSKDLIQMWRKREFPSGASQKEIVTLDQIDCHGAARYRSIELRVTYRDGTTQTFNKVTPWAKIYVGSAEEYLMNEHCK